MCLRLFQRSALNTPQSPRLFRVGVKVSIDKMTTACAVYEFRSSETNFENIHHIRDILKLYCKKYVFQLEEGDSGYRHYQGRISLIKKRREPELKKLLESNDHLKFFNYLKPTLTKEHNTTAFYVMKLDTRIQGPFSDTDFIPTNTRQLQYFKSLSLRPYQKSILDLTYTFNLRTIYLIFDPVGNIGKSLFSEYLESLGETEEIPPFRLMEEIFSWVCSRPVKKNYIVDMPRGMKKDKLGEFYSGLEVIKNGVAYDKRYSAKKIRFDRPNIFVFTNTLPKFSLMSKDRWIIYEVNEDYELMDHTEIYMEEYI